MFKRNSNHRPAVVLGLCAFVTLAALAVDFLGPVQLSSPLNDAENYLQDFFTCTGRLTPANTNLVLIGIDRPSYDDVIFSDDAKNDPILAALRERFGDLVFDTAADSLKGKSLRRDPRVALCVDDEHPPFSFVTIEGIATVEEDLEEVTHWATVIGGRYMGPENAEQYGRRNGVPGELVVRVRPTNIVAVADVVD